MIRPRFFWKLFASYALVAVTTAGVIGYLVQGRLEGALVEGVESSLEDQGVLLEPLGLEAFQSHGGGEELDGELLERVQDMGRRVGVRITLIDLDPEGVVLADSEVDAREMENHRDRVEVREALEHGSAISRRLSTTIERNLLYAARVVPDRERPEGVIRLSVSLDAVEGQLASMRGRVTAGALIGALVALVMGLLVARRITRPIAEMTGIAEAMVGGDYRRRVRGLPDDELGVLGEAFNRLGAVILDRLSALASDEAKLRAMLAGMAEGVVAVDDEDRVVFTNHAARALLGIGTRDVAGASLWELVRIPELDELFQAARGQSGAARCELALAREGRERILRVQAHPFVSTEARGVVAVFDDVTELRRLERIRRDFVANVSHELKTPLTSIRGFVETLLDGALHDEGNNERFLRKVQDNVMRLNHLVTDLLSLARIEDQGGLELTQLDLRGLAVEAVRRHEANARRRGIELGLAGPPDTLSVEGDRESITQVIDNLVANAIQYTGEGGTVTLRLGREAERGVLRVEDTGIGIPPEDLERIFERFYRVDKARSRAMGGTGLGLSIVKHLVQAMGGEVRVRSQYGRGSTFEVRLDLAEG